MDSQKFFQKRLPTSGRVIPWRRDAAFFFERAVYYMERNNWARALKFFRKACEYDPDNAVHQCNLAGVLSELGRFEESNDVLRNILEQIDPDMNECYFYMANNYANLGLYELAEEYAARYLEREPQGEFASEAEEMLEILVAEFGGGKILRQHMQHRANYRVPEQAEALRLIQEGKFMEASSLLRRLVEKYPDELALQNNLSLTHYYLGQLDQAMELAQQVLARDAGNIHALCNLAIYYQYVGRKKELSRLLRLLKKLYPLPFEQGYKLATTMGILGQHADAYRLFVYLCRFSNRLDPALLHCVAAAAYNMGKIQRAERIWKSLVQVEEDHSVASFYLKQLEQVREGTAHWQPVGYDYQLPFHEQFKRMKEQLQEGSFNIWKNDPLIRSSLFWALRHGDVETKTQVIQTFALIADQEVEQALRAFILSEDEIDSLKKLAIYVLRQMGVEGPYEAVLDQQKVMVRMPPVWREDLLERRKEWRLVWDDMEEKLTDWGEQVLAVARDIWLEFLEKASPSPRIVKVQSWSAAVAYLAFKHLGANVTQGEMARLFHVSTVTISKISRQIADTLNAADENL